MTVSSYALVGDIATMNHDRDVIRKGVVYVRNDTIEAVTKASDPVPPGFEDAPRLAVGGTIYPGLIELHNHLAYNALPMWKPPGKYQAREQWRREDEYRKYISGPMAILGSRPYYVEAIVRYVECKCLLGGVTTSQGLTLMPAPDIKKQFSGIVRNAELPDDAALPAAHARVEDVETADELAKKLSQARPGHLLLHVAEGLYPTAEGHFLKFQRPDGTWAINSALVGIHCTGLHGDDWKVLAEGGGSMVWSPLSNLMLYGDTADVRAAKAAGVRIALGSDWTPSGSKNLLWELKIAYLWSKLHGGIFTEQELVEMATVRAAEILGWESKLGAIAPGMRADLVVIKGSRGDPYRRLLKCEESAIQLVVIRGIPRVGIHRLMKKFDVPTETYGDRLLHLADPASYPVVGALTLEAARARLSRGMQALPHPPDPPARFSARAAGPCWTLALEEDEAAGAAMRPLAPVTAIADLPRAAVPPEAIVKPMALDPLTVSEDPEAYLRALEAQPNLPAEIPHELRKLQHRLAA
ncbi:MAG TPA: amidohydrolase family protein [Kofleriaceae bacterium]|nr:amidohydrolase family protein [Kofleriaceae bacterium]